MKQGYFSLAPVFMAVMLSACGGLEYNPERGAGDVATLLRRLAAGPDIGRRWQLAGDFLAKRKNEGALLVENGRVHFFVWDEQPRVKYSLVGPFNRWRVGALPFVRLYGTPLMHAELKFRPYVSLEYMIASSRGWFPDPLCRDTRRDNSGRTVSFFSPLRKTWPSWAWTPEKGRRGTVRVLMLKSGYFRNERPVLIYTPPGATGEKAWRLLVLQAPFLPACLPLYRNIFDNLTRAAGAANTLIAVVPVLDAEKELPLRAVDYIDMLKHELSRELSRLGWAPAGAGERILVMRGRGAGFLILSLFKGVKYFNRLYAVEPDTGPYKGFLSYFSRLKRPGLLSGISLTWVLPGGKPAPRFHDLRRGLAGYGLQDSGHLPLPVKESVPEPRIAVFRRMLAAVFTPSKK